MCYVIERGKKLRTMPAATEQKVLLQHLHHRHQPPSPSTAATVASPAAGVVSPNSDSDKFIVLRGRRIVKKKKRKCVKCKYMESASNHWGNLDSYYNQCVPLYSSHLYCVGSRNS